MNKIFIPTSTFIVCILASLSTYAYELRVTNNTPFPIEVKCKKKGLVKTHWKKIEPNGKKGVGCGAADCHNGIKVKILGEQAGWKDLEFDNNWSLQCSSADVSIVAIPQLVKEQGAYDPVTHTQKTTYTVKSFKLAIVRDLEITSETIKFECEAKK